MQVITISKDKTPAIKDWAVDKEPGDRVRLSGTIKANDDQTLTITVEEVHEQIDDEDEEETDKPIGGNEGSDAAPVGSVPGMTPGLGDNDAP